MSIKYFFRKAFLLFLLSFSVSNSFAITHQSDKDKKLLASYKGGQLYQEGPFKVAVLHGSFYQMGEQYGHLLKKEIQSTYKVVIYDTFIKSKLTTVSKIKKNYVDRAWASLPTRFKRLYEGASHTSGLSTDQLIALDGYLSVALLHIEHMFGPHGAGACSFISVNGPYTKDGSMIVARNFDWLNEFQRLSKELVVTVFLPQNTDENKVATIGYAGSLSTFSGFNDKHLFIELNSGAHSAGIMLHNHMASYKNEILGLLFDSDSFSGLADRVNTIKPDWATIINIANPDKSISFENAPFQTLRRKAKNGLLVATNQYRNPNWNLPLKSGPGVTYSKMRYDHLVSLANTHKGAITPDVMRSMMSKSLYNEKGDFLDGATKTYPKGNQDVTVYQLMYQPKDFNLWIRVPQHSDWQKIDVGQFFQ